MIYHHHKPRTGASVFSDAVQYLLQKEAVKAGLKKQGVP